MGNRRARRTAGGPEVSVLVTAKDARELATKVRELKEQDHPSFEVVAARGGTITEGYNRAIRKARGKILVFTETDAVPLSGSWLRELVRQVRPGEVVKGLELLPQIFNFSNTACFSDVAKRIPLDESYPLGSDTEWQQRLARHGIGTRFTYAAGVLHLRTPASRKALRRAYEYGRTWVRLYRAYRYEEFHSLVRQARNLRAIAQASLRGVSDEWKASRSPRRRRRRA